MLDIIQSDGRITNKELAEAVNLSASACHQRLQKLTDQGWMILTKRLAAFFFGLAIVNELVWRLMSEEAWVYFKTFGLTAAIFLFFMGQGRLFRDHGTQTDDNG